MAFRVVVLVSGSGTLLQALLDAPAAITPAEIVAVGSEVPDCQGLARARAAGVPAFCVPMPSPLRRDSPERLRWDAEMTDAVAAWQPDLVLLAGFMKLLGAPFMQRFGGRIVNTHPAMLPLFPGPRAVRDVLVAGATSTGASIFWVDEGIDTGALIAREPVPIEPGDDEPTLHERIKVTERRLLVHTIAGLARAATAGPDTTPPQITDQLEDVR